MILKALKEKSIKKKINFSLQNRRLSNSNTKLETLGVIINADEINNLETLRPIYEALGVRENKLKIITFIEPKKQQNLSWNACYSSKNFSWNGTLNNPEIQSFLNTEFDVLISYYSQDILELKYATATSKAKFKVGVFQKDKRINDLIIKTELKAIDIFVNELKKYLNILNKI